MASKKWKVFEVQQTYSLQSNFWVSDFKLSLIPSCQKICLNLQEKALTFFDTNVPNLASDSDVQQLPSRSTPRQISK